MSISSQQQQPLPLPTEQPWSQDIKSTNNIVDENQTFNYDLAKLRHHHQNQERLSPICQYHFPSNPPPSSSSHQYPMSAPTSSPPSTLPISSSTSETDQQRASPYAGSCSFAGCSHNLKDRTDDNIHHSGILSGVINNSATHPAVAAAQGTIDQLHNACAVVKEADTVAKMSAGLYLPLYSPP